MFIAAFRFFRNASYTFKTAVLTIPNSLYQKILSISIADFANKIAFFAHNYTGIPAQTVICPFFTEITTSDVVFVAVFPSKNAMTESF